MTVAEMKQCIENWPSDTVELKFWPKSVTKVKDERGNVIKCYYMDIIKSKVASMIGRDNFTSDGLIKNQQCYILKFKCDKCFKSIQFKAKKDDFKAMIAINWEKHKPKENSSKFKGCACTVEEEWLVEEDRKESNELIADYNLQIDQSLPIQDSKNADVMIENCCESLTPKQSQQKFSSLALLDDPRTPRRLVVDSLTPRRLLVDSVTPKRLPVNNCSSATKESTQDSPMFSKLAKALKTLPKDKYKQTVKLFSNYVENLSQFNTVDNFDGAKIDIAKVVSVQSYRDNSASPLRDSQDILNRIAGVKKRKKSLKGISKKQKRRRSQSSSSSTSSVIDIEAIDVD